MENNVGGRIVMSNLPLQMALYFNVITVPIWTLTIILFIYKNYFSYDELYKYITVTVVITSLSIEIIRLYLGYEGNLKDKIPELAVFWMLSLLLQFPLQGFLLCNPVFRMNILERVIQGIMFSLLLIQLITGFVALRRTVKYQAKDFEMRKDERNEKKNENK